MVGESVCQCGHELLFHSSGYCRDVNYVRGAAFAEAKPCQCAAFRLDTAALLVRTDTERLDWLEQEGPGIDYPSRHRGGGVRLYWGESPERTPAHELIADNWRGAIDAAMDAAAPSVSLSRGRP